MQFVFLNQLVVVAILFMNGGSLISLEAARNIYIEAV